MNSKNNILLAVSMLLVFAVAIQVNYAHAAIFSDNNPTEDGYIQDHDNNNVCDASA